MLLYEKINLFLCSYDLHLLTEILKSSYAVDYNSSFVIILSLMSISYSSLRWTFGNL